METTFGRDSQKVNIIIGGFGSSPQTQTFDKTDGMLLLTDFLAKHDSDKAAKRNKRAQPVESQLKAAFASPSCSPAESKPVAFRAGTEQEPSTTIVPPVRSGRAVELD